MELQYKLLNSLIEFRFPAVLTKQRPLLPSILIGCTMLLLACHTRQATTNHTIKEAKQVITISRSNADFEFYLTGQLKGKFRVFGFNPNPFGANNRDEYVVSIGVPLLTTNIFVANAIDSATEEFAQKNCEKSAAENSQ